MSFWNKLFGGGPKPKPSPATESQKREKVKGEYEAWADENNIKCESEAWAKLKRPDLMLSLMDSKGVKLGESNMRLFVCDCAEAVLPYFEARYPEDKRPRQAIETARHFAKGETTREVLSAAEAAGWTAFTAARAVRSALNDITESAHKANIHCSIQDRDGFRDFSNGTDAMKTAANVAIAMDWIAAAAAWAGGAAVYAARGAAKDTADCAVKAVDAIGESVSATGHALDTHVSPSYAIGLLADLLRNCFPCPFDAVPAKE